MGDHNINYPKLAAYHYQLSLQALQDPPPESLSIECDNFAAVYWVFRGSISINPPAATILRTSSMLLQKTHLSFHIGFLPGTRNSMSDRESCLWDLTNNYLIHIFNSDLPQDE